MTRKTIISFCLFIFLFHLSYSQVRIRLFTGRAPQYFFFKVLSGKYTIRSFPSDSVVLSDGDMVLFACFESRVAVKTRSRGGFAADSVLALSSGNDSRFSLETSENDHIIKICSGDLRCLPDLATLVMINICSVDSYVAGVVKAEGGNGKNKEYFKTQAVIARTYTYRYFNRHNLDGYNLCDGTHCQVFNGTTEDSIIIRAVTNTRDLVIVTPDSNLIISAFHSNCGGETSPSEYIWPTKQDYLVKVTDPYCAGSRNASWTKTIPVKAWQDMLKINGYKGTDDTSAVMDFSQPSRVQDYETGSFRLPFSTIRKDLDLRSTWFSVNISGDSVKLSGRGYGHGVGLCQEGAMVMAGRGSSYRDIISFYYPGVKLLKIDYVKKTDEDNSTLRNKQGN